MSSVTNRLFSQFTYIIELRAMNCGKFLTKCLNNMSLDFED